MASRNVRLGLILFFVYLAFYAAFVLLAAFSPATMERIPWAGVNLAIWYGFALIVVALVLALIYGGLCRLNDADQPSESAANQTRNHKSDIRNS